MGEIGFFFVSPEVYEKFIWTKWPIGLASFGRISDRNAVIDNRIKYLQQASDNVGEGSDIN